MRIYQLTEKGRKFSRRIGDSQAPAGRVIHYLANTGSASDERLSAWVGLGSDELKVILRRLKQEGVVEEAGGREGEP